MSNFLLVPARNKMYKGAAGVHFISAGTSKKSEMFYIIWLNVGGAMHFITVAKSYMYCIGVKSMASGLTSLHQKQYVYSLPIHLTFCNCNKMYSTFNI